MTYNYDLYRKTMACYLIVMHMTYYLRTVTYNYGLCLETILESQNYGLISHKSNLYLITMKYIFQL